MWSLPSFPIIFFQHSLWSLSAPYTLASLAPHQGQLDYNLRIFVPSASPASTRNSHGCCLLVILVTVLMSLPRDAFLTTLVKGILPSSHYFLSYQTIFFSFISIWNYFNNRSTAYLSQLVYKLLEGKNFASLVHHCIPVPKKLPST